MPSYAMDQSTADSITLSPPGADQWISLRLDDAHQNPASVRCSSKILNSPSGTSATAGNQLQPQSFVPGTLFENNRFTIIIHSPRSLDQPSLSRGGLNFEPEVEIPSTIEEEDEEGYFEYPVVRSLHLAFSKAKQSATAYSRSLTPEFNVFCDDMTAVASAPGSPPDLSESRSSKSSSYASTSHFSYPGDGAMADVSNFEEIGLEEEKSPASTLPYSANTSRTTKRPLAPRVRTTVPWVAPTASPRDPRSQPHSGSQSQTQSAGLKHNNADTPALPALPRGSSFVKRTFTSPSMNSLHLPSPPEPRSRSNSPARRTFTVTTANQNLHPGPVSPRSSLPLPSRRSSWQPNRKSIQELEAEYHDSDDDLPEDASLWNVPMSPRPPEDRASPRSSHRGSPERESGPKPIPLSHATTAPDTPPQRSPVFRTMSRVRPPPPRTSSLNASAVSATPPSVPNSRRIMRHQRAKSWTLAISELSEEAKVLSENLEHHAGEVERAQENRLQNGSKSTRPSLETSSNRSSMRSSAIQLPPIQTGALDFMPISKEKEAVLSRTRPSWLPPKNPREEQKHLKEYQRMMAASLEAERKREAKLHMRQCQQHDTRESLNRIWEVYAASDADASASEASIQELWWRGVSPKVRGEVWQRAIGNSLALTEASYIKALARAREIQGLDSASLSDREKFMVVGFIDIKRDAETAFPELNLFQPHGPLWQDLVNVCEAYTCYRSDIGYVYGMQLIAALLLLQLQTPSAVFILLANCLNRPMPLAFMCNDRGSTARSYGFAMSTLAIKFPRLHAYLFGVEEKGGLAMNGEEVFEPMLRTIFASGLDADRLSRVWDCWVFDGDRTLVRTAVALLGCLQAQIFDIDGTLDTKRRNIQDMLGWGPYGRVQGYWDLQAAGDQDAFMDEVREAGKLDYTGR
jgi:hypothetical protein